MLQEHAHIFDFKRVFACEHQPLLGKAYVDISLKKNITGLDKLKNVFSKGKRETDLQKVIDQQIQSIIIMVK